MNKQNTILIMSSSPHVHSTESISSAMRDVIIALIPALLASLYFFCWNSAKIVVICVVTALISEAFCQRVMKKRITIKDNSAVITGMLLAFCLPPTLPLWMAAVGSFIAIVIGKQVFGGLGNNIFNPALVGRAVLLASWPVAMTNWVVSVDEITTATPMSILKEATRLNDMGLVMQLPSIQDLLVGNTGGSIGETSALALIIGGIYLIYKGHVDWRIPAAYLGSVFVITLVTAFLIGQGIWYPLFQTLAGGGLLIGAIFMASDWVTSPITRKGKIIFGLGCGILTVLIRFKGGYPEGVCYSILLMNAATPLIDRFTKEPVFGRRRYVNA